MTRGLLLLGFLVLPALPVAHASDQIVHGLTLVVKNPGAAAKRKVTLKAKETATDNTLVGDPTVGGATVTVTLDGASPRSAGKPSNERTAWPCAPSAPMSALVDTCALKKSRMPAS